jgi:hypothetical protein
LRGSHRVGHDDSVELGRSYPLGATRASALGFGHYTIRVSEHVCKGNLVYDLYREKASLRVVNDHLREQGGRERIEKRVGTMMSNSTIPSADKRFCVDVLVNYYRREQEAVREEARERSVPIGGHL